MDFVENVQRTNWNTIDFFGQKPKFLLEFVVIINDFLIINESWYNIYIIYLYNIYIIYLYNSDIKVNISFLAEKLPYSQWYKNGYIL